MLTIDNMGAVRQHGLYMDSLKHSKVGALMQKNFFEEIFPALAQHTEFAYPYKVGIPKSLNAMLEGDFSLHNYSNQTCTRNLYTELVWRYNRWFLLTWLWLRQW